MKKRLGTVFLFCLLSILLFGGCGRQTDDKSADRSPMGIDGQTGNAKDWVESETLETTEKPLETEIADGYELLGGKWKVGGLYSKNRLIDVHDNDAIGDLFDTTFLSFQEDGTYLYYDLFWQSGNYVRLPGNESDTFLLKADYVYQLVMEDDQLVEKECTSGRPYLVTVIAGDENTLLLCEYDSFTGKAKANDEPLVFVKEGEDSLYIPEYKTDISGNSAKPRPTDPVSQGEHGNATMGEKNALQKAKDYLAYMAFSETGLIEQLEYEGYSHSEAVYGVEHCGADWMEQAARKAADYLDYMAFSRTGLIEQLEYEGFTHEQAVYGVEQNGY